MALKKAITLENGATGEYIKIQEVEFRYAIDRPGDFCITALLFFNEAYRRADKPALDRRIFRPDLSKLDDKTFDLSNPIAAAYMAIKVLPELEGASDC